MPERDKDLTATAKFPFGGIDRSRETFTQPAGSTPDGTNVRAFDRHGRMRGGSRSGLSRYIDERVNGAAAIQHMAVIVSTHADALGWSFGGRDFGFTGIYGGIGFFGLPAGEDEASFPEGGGGYTTQERPRYTLTLSVDDNEVPADGVSDATITALLRDEFNAPPTEPHTIELRTNIGGRVGDRVQGQTDSGGQVQFNVTNTREESVLYNARDITGRVRSTGSVKVTYLEVEEIGYIVYAFGECDADAVVGGQMTLNGVLFDGDADDICGFIGGLGFLYRTDAGIEQDDAMLDGFDGCSGLDIGNLTYEIPRSSFVIPGVNTISFTFQESVGAPGRHWITVRKMLKVAGEWTLGELLLGEEITLNEFPAGDSTHGPYNFTIPAE